VGDAAPRGSCLPTAERRKGQVDGPAGCAPVGRSGPILKVGLAAAGDRVAVVAATLAIFFLSTALTAASDAAAGDLAPPHRRAEVMSGYSDWIDVGSALGPVLAFILVDSLGLRANYGLTAFILLVVGVQFLFAWRREPDYPARESRATGH
jgi:MFS family permease